MEGQGEGLLDVPMTLMEREIREQPELLTSLLEVGRARAEAVARRVREAEPSSVFIAARGTSDNAARYAQYLLGVHNRLAVGLATPSLFTVYDAPPSYSQSLVIGISQSGQSPDIVSVVAEARRQGALTLAITNDDTSPLATTAELCFDVHAGEERAVAATKTYTTQLFALAMISSALANHDERWRELARVPELMRETLALNAEVAVQTARYTYAERFVVIGRGFNYATAFETALKLKETSYVVAEPFSSADFLHGPIAMIDRGFPAVVVAPSGRVFDEMGILVERLRERGAEAITITDRVNDVPGSSVVLPLPSAPEWLSPLTAIVPGQLLALSQATLRGLNPDQPRGLSKVTHTR